MYDPSTGRFLSEDPLGQYAGDVNVYRYVGNSPFAASDPSRQLAWFAPALFGAGIGAAANYGFYAYKNWGNQTFSGAAKAIAAGGLAGAYGGVAFYGVTAPALGAARPIFGVIADGIVSGGLLNAFNGEDPIMGAATGGIAAPLGYLILKPIASRIGNYCAARLAKPKAFPQRNAYGSIEDLSHFDPDGFPANIANRTDKDINGFLDVVAHGCPEFVEIAGRAETAAYLARIIAQDANFAGKVRLIACLTGNSMVEGKGQPFAQRLANALQHEIDLLLQIHPVRTFSIHAEVIATDGMWYGK